MGRRTSFVAWISVTRPETMKMAFTMFDDNANGRPMAPATNTGSSHTFDTSTCCNPSRAFFGVTFFSADEPASATLVSVFFLVAASPCGCVCVDGFSLAMVSLLDFHWVCAQAEIQTEIVFTGRDAFCRYCSYASITLIRSRVRAVARLSRIRHPLYFDAPNHNATVQPKQEKIRHACPLHGDACRISFREAADAYLRRLMGASSNTSSDVFATSGLCVTMMTQRCSSCANIRKMPMMSSCVAGSRLPVGSSATMMEGP